MILVILVLLVHLELLDHLVLLEFLDHLVFLEHLALKRHSPTCDNKLGNAMIIPPAEVIFNLRRARSLPSLRHRWGSTNHLECLQMLCRVQYQNRDLLLRDRKYSHMARKDTFA